MPHEGKTSHFGPLRVENPHFRIQRDEHDKTTVRGPFHETQRHVELFAPQAVAVNTAHDHRTGEKEQKWYSELKMVICNREDIQGNVRTYKGQLGLTHPRR